MDDVCVGGRDFFVTLKPQTREEALKKVLAKCRVVQNPSGIMTKGRYKSKEVNIFRTGRLMIREFNGQAEAQRFLEELFE
jgi:ribonuclease HIII